VIPFAVVAVGAELTQAGGGAHGGSASQAANFLGLRPGRAQGSSGWIGSVRFGGVFGQRLPQNGQT